MPIYETLCILHPELPQTRTEELIGWMQKLLEDGQGTVLQADKWGLRNLAYQIKKNKRGYYVLLEHESSPLTLKELERNLRLSEDCLRYFSVVREAPSKKARAQAEIPAPGGQPSTDTTSADRTEEPSQPDSAGASMDEAPAPAPEAQPEATEPTSPAASESEPNRQ